MRFTPTLSAHHNRKKKKKRLSLSGLIRKKNKTCRNEWAEHFGEPYTIKIWWTYVSSAMEGWERGKSTDLKCWNKKHNRWQLIYTLPVLPFICAVDEVLWDFLDVFQISIAVRVKERQPGLDEGAGGLIHATSVIVLWIETVELRLGQDQVH